MSKPVYNPTFQQTDTAEAIQAWLVEQIAEQLKVETDEIDVGVPFESLGLDSAQAMIIFTRGEKLLGFLPAPVLLWHYPTIELLSERLAEEFEDLDSEVLEI